MLSDIASECNAKDMDTAASAVLSVALAWAHIGEEKRARSTHAEAAALKSSSKIFQEVLRTSAAAFRVPQEPQRAEQPAAS
jgi:hypothetical protein